MKPERAGRVITALLATGMLAGVPACQRLSTGSAAGSPPAAQAKTETKALLAEHRGKVLLLLVGREDCPGTAAATPLLDDYAKDKPPGVDIVRLDVPLPGEQLKVGAWNHPYPRRIDAERRLADELDFFYYPTLYVFDRGGELRFTGGFDPEPAEAMVKEILAETPGQPKKVYTVPLPAIGTPAPAFTGKTLAGQEATLASLRGERGTLLFFGRTICPYSTGSLPAVKAIAEAHRKNGVAVAIINQREDKEEIQPVYQKEASGVPVVWDATGEICKAFGVDTVPFFFLLNKDGAIAQRRSFSPQAATGAINALLGLATQAPRYPTTKAG